MWWVLYFAKNAKKNLTSTPWDPLGPVTSEVWRCDRQPSSSLETFELVAKIIQSSDHLHRWLPRVSEWVAGPGNQTPCPPLQALRALEIIIKKWKFWFLVSINRFITSCNILPENPVLFFHIQDMSDSNLAICCHYHQLLPLSPIVKNINNKCHCCAIATPPPPILDNLYHFFWTPKTLIYEIFKMTHYPKFFINKGRILALWVMYST